MKKIAVLIGSLIAAAMIACSSASSGPVVADTPDSGQVGSPGAVAAPGPTTETVTPAPVQPIVDAGKVDSGKSDSGLDAGPTNQAECIAACEATHPNAAKQNADLDSQCMHGAECGTVCDNIGQGPSLAPDATSSASCDTVSAKSYPIGTPSQACSNCLATNKTCCSLWISIFGSTEGQGLNTCAQNCWDTFKQ